MTATYDMSSYGKPIVVREGTAELSAIRVIFITIIIGWALVLMFKECLLFWTLWTECRVDHKPNTPKRQRIMNWLFGIYRLSALLHTVHYVDNILRPVDYFEPKYLYQKYVISTMEITFFLNFPIILMGFYGSTRLLTSISKSHYELINRKCSQLLLFALFTILPVLHYRIEPPRSYSFAINITIIGGLFMAFFLTLIIVLILYLNHKRYFTSYSSENFSQLIQMNDDFVDSNSDEEIETINKDQLPARKRSRSKTPVRTTQLQF